MSKGKQRISKIAKGILERHSKEDGIEYTNIAYGDLDLLHEVFDEAGMFLSNDHPLNKHQAVLNALDRGSKQENAIFEKEFFRSFKGLARIFELKQENL